jgi:hypothetical protein
MTNYINKSIETNKNQIFDFIVHTLRFGDPKIILNFLSSRENSTLSDEIIYDKLQKKYSGNVSKYDIYTSLQFQKKLLSDQAFEMYTHIKKTHNIRKINDILTIGDPGRYVNSLVERFNTNGSVYIAHDKHKMLDIIETGNIFSSGNYVDINYNHVDDVILNESSLDMITCFMGFHHFDEKQLMTFVKLLHVSLRPSGILLLREHDGSEKNIPIANIAHDIYNSLLNVSKHENNKEIRNFRPIYYWKTLIESCGFTMVEKTITQSNDPTHNNLLCFIKKTQNFDTVPITLQHTLDKTKNYVKPLNQTYQTTAEWLLVDIAQYYGSYLEHTPFYMFPYKDTIYLFWKIFYLSIKNAYIKCGYKSLFSQYIIMNFFIGIVITIIFLILMILSIPPSLVYGEDIDSTIKCVVYNTSNEDTSNINKDIVLLNTVDNFEFLEINRYKNFRKSILDLIDKKYEIIEIAGQQEIQIKIKSHENLPKFKEELYRYKISDSHQYEILLGVNVLNLSDICKLFKSHDIEINYIYDF